jgi:hypothetical protein
VSFLTGKSKPATSSNQAYGYLQGAYDPQVSQGVGATNFLAQLLGTGGDPSQANAAYDQFKNASGYQNAFNEANRGVTNSAAGRGLLGSGATAQALQSTAGNLAQGTFSNFLQQLGGLAGLGNQAGSIIGGAGAQSTGGQKTPGLLDYAGTAASIFSDERLKRDIKKVSEMSDGLGVYQYRYKGRNELQTGVIAQEVAKLRPWALGPEIGGYMTVNYGRL